MDLLQSTNGLVVRYSFALEAAVKDEQRMIYDAVVAHSSLPPNYWQPRWQLENKLKAAQAMQEILR